MARPTMTVSYDPVRNSVFLEWEAYDPDRKLFEEFENLVRRVGGTWRKRKGAKYSGRLIPAARFSSVQVEIGRLYNLVFAPARPEPRAGQGERQRRKAASARAAALELEVPTAVEDCLDSWTEKDSSEDAYDSTFFDKGQRMTPGERLDATYLEANGVPRPKWPPPRDG